MKREQADIIAADMKGLITTMTDAQVRMARDAIEKVDDDDVLRERLREYVQSNERFNVATFVAAITPAHGGETPAERTRRELDAAKAYKESLEQQWAEADAVIDGMSDVELAEAVERAFLNLDVDMRHLVPSQRKRCYGPDGAVNRAGLTRLVKSEILKATCLELNP